MTEDLTLQYTYDVLLTCTLETSIILLNNVNPLNLVMKREKAKKIKMVEVKKKKKVLWQKYWRDRYISNTKELDDMNNLSKFVSMFVCENGEQRR